MFHGKSERKKRSNESRQKCQKKIGSGASEGYFERSPFLVSKIVGVIRNRFGISKSKACGQKKGCWDQDRTKRVNMTPRRQRNSASVLGRLISKPESNHSMRNLMDYHGVNEGEEVESYQDNFVRHDRKFRV